MLSPPVLSEAERSEHASYFFNRLASVQELKFVKDLVRLFVVIPAQAGIQKHLIFLDSGLRWLSPAWPE